jgi:hypothetical protein
MPPINPLRPSHIDLYEIYRAMETLRQADARLLAALLHRSLPDALHLQQDLAHASLAIAVCEGAR